MFKRKWKEVYERLPIERKEMNLAEIAGFDKKFCVDHNSLRQKVFEKLLKELGDSKISNICEIGCGCGDKLSPFYALGHNCFGVDYSGNMIKRGKKELPEAKLYISEANVLPLKDNSMDLVFSYSVFQYFETMEYCNKVLSEMYRIAKPSAVICIYDIPDNYEKDKVVQLRGGEHQKGYEHTYYDMNTFIQWFKSKNIFSVKSEYFFIPEYKHSYHRFNIIARLNK